MALHILVVEDEPAFADVLSELLSDEGYSVLHVRDGLTALNMITAQPARQDLIVCDVMLPVLRGDSLTAEIRRRLPSQRLPILLLSASADPQIHLRDVSFMAKPFETVELLAQIERMLAHSRTAAAN